MGTTRLIFQDRNEEYTYVLVDVQPAARKESKFMLSCFCSRLNHSRPQSCLPI